MIIQLIIGAILIALTVVFQAFSFDLIIKKVQWLEKTALRKQKGIWKAAILAIVALGVSCVLIVEIWIWGLFYLVIGVMPDLESTLYFSTTTFTTVGYGDVVLERDWRLLSSIESLNGFLLFGWSTAFIFEIVSRIYRKEGKAIEN